MALAGGELLLIAFVLLLVYWIRHSAIARRDRKAAARLIAQAREGKAEREAAIGRFLSQNMGLSGKALEQLKVAMLREELRLLQRFADTYRRRDSAAAAQFQLSVEAALIPYMELRGSGEATTTDEAKVDDDELKELRARNEHLSEELSITMDTMSRMLSEYSTMFATVTDSAEEPASEAAAADSAPAAQERAPKNEPTEGMAEGIPGSAREAIGPVSADMQGMHADDTIVVSESDDVEVLACDIEAVLEGGEWSSMDDAEMRRRAVLPQEEFDIAELDEQRPHVDPTGQTPEAGDVIGEENAFLSDPDIAGVVEEVGADEQPVEPQEIDQQLEWDPLEAGLDNLFDGDDMAVLDDEGAEKKDEKDGDDGAIAI
jgi:hypothetical protein